MELYLIIIISVISALLVLLLLRKFFRGPNAKSKDMSGKIVIVTGSSSGIGKETAYELLKQGATVIFACRNETKTLQVIEYTKEFAKTNNKESLNSPFSRAMYMKLDLESLTSVVDFVHEFKSKFSSLDILINNAGYFADNYKLTEDGLEAMIQTNHYSHVLLTTLLLDHFKSEDGRVINIASQAYQQSNYSKKLKTCFPKDTSDQFKELFNSFKGKACAYGNTKYANILFTEYLEETFRKNSFYENMSCYSLHPGVVNSDFFNFKENSCCMKFTFFIFYPIIYFMTKTNNDGAQTTLHLCYEDKKKLISGAFYSDCNVNKLIWVDKDHELRDFLMNETNKVLKPFIDSNITPS